MRTNQIPAVTLTTFLAACADQSVMLNSERIEQRFGSYSIEVLASENGIRRSSLASGEGDAKTCRTYAVVEFADQLDHRIAGAHQKIQAGGSIGATLKEEGWEIYKQTLYIGEVALPDASTEMRRWMRLEGPHDIALHAYRLVVVDGETELAYATILEGHHPDYLDAAALQRIYVGDSGATTPEYDLTQFTDLLFYQ